MSTGRGFSSFKPSDFESTDWVFLFLVQPFEPTTQVILFVVVYAVFLEMASYLRSIG